MTLRPLFPILSLALLPIVLCQLGACGSVSAGGGSGGGAGGGSGGGAGGGGSGVPAGFTAMAERSAPMPTDNPLRGFFTYVGSSVGDFETSLEFFYVGLAELMSGPSSFTFDAGLEPRLDAIAARGRQAIVRVYLDYPDNPPHQVPAHLVSGCGGDCVSLTEYASHGGGQSPDYEASALRAALTSFIDAFGERYDGDPRLAYVQVGLLGFWGEWHTYPDVELMASASTRSVVLDAFEEAFTTTRVVVSADALGYADFVAGSWAPGFHDDDFGSSTLTQSWGYHARLEAAGRADVHLSESVGGEVQPSIQSTALASDESAAELLDAVQQTHASWLLYYALFNSLPEAHRTRARAIVAQMGYELRVAAYRAEPGANTVDVRIENRGIAPFPYAWAVQLRVTPSEGAPAEITTDWDPSAIAPGETLTFSIELGSPLPAGPFELALRVVQPLEGGRPVTFANEVHDGAWVVLGVE